MAVYLGDKGRVVISRTQSRQSAMFTTLNVDDVAVERRRLSIDGAAFQLITGDRVRFKTQDGSDLQFVLSLDTADDDIIRFVHVDAMGGIRLYDTFSEAIKGGKALAIELDAPTSAQEITVKVMGEPSQERCVANVRNFSITTSRENIDTTCLNQDFRNNYENGLIAGQGTLNCLWSYETDCADAIDSQTKSNSLNTWRVSASALSRAHRSPATFICTTEDTATTQQIQLGTNAKTASLLTSPLVSNQLS